MKAALKALLIYFVTFTALPGPLLMLTAIDTLDQSLPAPPVDPDRSSSSDAHGPMTAGPEMATAGSVGISGGCVATSTAGDADAQRPQTSAVLVQKARIELPGATAMGELTLSIVDEEDASSRRRRLPKLPLLQSPPP